MTHSTQSTLSIYLISHKCWWKVLLHVHTKVTTALWLKASPGSQEKLVTTQKCWQRGRQAAAQAGQSSCSTTLHSGGALPARASHRASPWQHQQLSKPETRHFQTGYTSFVCQALKITLHQCFQSTCEILWDTKPALPNSWANWLMLLHPPNHQHHL